MHCTEMSKPLSCAHSVSRTGSRNCIRRTGRAIVVACLLAVLAWCAPAFASGPGPNGINVGFDFNWNSGPGGYTASFIASTTASGSTLSNCAPSPLSALSSSCDFVFSYSIGGTPQTAVSPGGVYSTWSTPPASPFCDQNPSNSSPLTLYNCFNNNSFGQIFLASSTGALSNVAMRMTCLNPTGATITGMVANLYQINSNGSSIPSAPIASATLDLSSCPTATSWNGKTFSASDFADINLPFSGVTVQSGVFYGIYFAFVQSLTFPVQTPASQTFSAGTTFPINPVATSSTLNSGNPITYSSLTPGVCTVSGTTVTMVSAGTCTLAADQAGNGFYAAAPQVTQDVAIGPGVQTLSFLAQSPANQSFVSGGTFPINPLATSATPNSGNPIVYSSLTGGVCTVSATTVTIVAAGTCTLAANQAGNANYNAAAQQTQTVAIGLASQVISFTSTPPANPMVGGTYSVAATGGASGNPVTFSIDAASTANACTIAGNVVSFTGAGNCIVDANQAGSPNYAAAAQAQQTVVIGKDTTTTTLSASPNPAGAGQTITLTATVYGDPPTGTVTFHDGATTLGMGALTVTSATSSVATLAISNLTPGTHNLSATYAGDANNQASASAVVAVAVNTPPVAAPMLDGWAMLLLAGMMGAAAVSRWRYASGRIQQR